MSQQPRRHRSSTAASSPPEATKATAELQILLDKLSTTLQNPTEDTYPDLPSIVDQVQSIRRHLITSSQTSRSKDDFRHLHGFQILLKALRAFSGFYHPVKREQKDKVQIFELLENILGTLAHAFRDHYGNRRYFKRRVEGGGWAALEQTIASIGIGGSESDIWTEAQLLGRLLAFALDDKRFEALCETVAELHPSKTQTNETTSAENADSPVAPSQKTKEPMQPEQESIHSDEDVLNMVEVRLQAILRESSLLHYADIVPTIVDFWKTIPRVSDVPVNPAALVVILTLSKITSISNHSLLALHSTGVLSTLLPLALEQDSPLAATEKRSVETLCGSLMSLGISSLDDAQYLVSSQSAGASEFFLRTVKKSHTPAYIQFDLSLNGFASIELKTLARSFPPPSTVAGYTFTAWIFVDKFDPNAHTTIFGAYDETQTCFLLAYLEQDTHNFILQTSISSSRPSVRFKSTVFHERRWYHIAIVHRRPRTMTSSKAILYVDGEFAEQVKCQYPSPPPLTNASTDSFASFTSTSGKTHPVQAFLGTPQDLSTRLGRGVVFSRWSLASAHLIEDVISDDLVAVYYRLGPRYNGNFQDCMGSFQTYEASAALGMRQELMHPGKEDNSDILRAIRGKACTLVPESRIILSILPTAILGDDDRLNGHGSALLRGLNRIAANNLFQLTHNKGVAVAINGSAPSINEALLRPHGTAILTGEPVVIVPQALDDAMWRLGGFTGIALKLVEVANTRESIARAVENLFESINASWRNSEAMERENGYAILGALLRGKMGAGTVISSINGTTDSSSMSSEDRDQLGFQLLSLVLDFVGYCHKTPEESFIINPLAYRILLVDFDMWRKTTAITQRLYYKQFITFGVNSKYHEFNSRRLFRMRIVKRFLDALKAESFAVDVFPSFMEALTSLVKCNMTAEIFRSLALFITYAYHKPPSSASRTPRNPALTLPSRSSTRGPRRPTVSTVFDVHDTASLTMTKRQLGNKILEMYTDILCEKGTNSNLRKFARTVTNKWLLHLLTEDDPQVVVLGTKILARLLVIHGPTYASKFSGKTGGFTIMRHRLKRWWDIPTLWPICFSILFAQDVADIDFERSFELYSLLETFATGKIVYPNVLPVITTMLQHGLKDVLRNQDDPDSPLHDKGNGKDNSPSSETPRGRHRSMSLTKELESRQTQQPRKERLAEQVIILHTVIRFLADIHGKSQEFRDFALSSDYIRLLLAVLFPVIVSADPVSAETELNSRDSALTFEGDDVIIRPVSRVSILPPPIVRTSTVETLLPPSPTTPRAKPLRRGSSFILLTSRPSEYSPSSARLNLVMSPKKRIAAQKVSNAIVEGLLELVVSVFIDQVITRKEFPGFGLFLKVPPGFQEHQAYFESYLLRNMISQLGTTIQLDQKSLWEPRLIQNMARFILHIGEAVFEGWFLGGAEVLLDFAGTILEYLERPEVSRIKSVRLCSQAIASIKGVFLRVVLLRLSELDVPEATELEALGFMDKLLYWQTVVLSPDINEDNHLKLLCYQLYVKLVDEKQNIRLAAANIWRILLVQKPEDTSVMLRHAMPSEHKHLDSGFKRLTELDNETFVEWVDEHRPELDALFFGAMSRAWEDFVSVENEKTEETLKSRVVKRREKLKQWHAEDLNDDDILFRHDLASNLWMKNIYASEHLKHQRAQQDQQDTFGFLVSAFSKIDRELHRSCAVFDRGLPTKYKLDRTEGRNRMRLRMLPDRAPPTYDYQPKRRATESNGNGNGNDLLQVNTKIPSIGPNQQMDTTPSSKVPPPGAFDANGGSGEKSENISEEVQPSTQDNAVPEEDFELVDDPNDPGDDDGYEDKNRKVMRSLQRGDSVQHVFNISRIIGLEAVEGLLILGKDSLYLIDNVFQRSDGEIVNVVLAPKEERDPYLQMISGHKAAEKRPQPLRTEQESRSWKWSDVISISKRRFLFRDVAVEVFFTDGRSYLLTAISAISRDDLVTKLNSKAPHTSGSSALPNPEDGWRLESLKVAEEAPATFGSKFGNIFNSSAWNPAMRRWAKGEISNFHYLMLVNTMAGRTFNDLTQYPVFPWVLADYTSEELDLNNPASFRDLSKPMGAQHNSRQGDFIERYKTFAEMDNTTPAFHYGTHYSSAMIVTSYLIRLQPFVQSYLLLQGGSFDHPDRLFYSIEKAWNSASRDNMSDVRELIPEFFYLPEFLTNSNGYNFGLRQGNGGGIDTVQLPPWAKGDPKIFVAKHREALESPYVSKNLHQWIDLIFGCKQRGEAAIESVNVFHHLSYHGAKDLDAIEDRVERLATIGIIHNFGQTPHQVFSRPHQAREDIRQRPKRLDTSAESLTRLPFPLFESHERVATLIYSPKLDRLLCAAAFRVYLPPAHDKYMEWGFADNSVRFFFNDSKKPAGLFENLHQGQLSCVIFASSHTLITAGEDCVISAHTMVTSPSKVVDLQPRSSLFGHKTPVTVLSVSKSFSTMLSASSDGTVLLWDLNRLEFVRKLTHGRAVECARINDVSGDIMLCRGQKLALYTLNGDPILEQNVCGDLGHDDYIHSCAFYQGTGNEWLESTLIFTGHRRGIVCIWRKVVGKDSGKWQLELVKRLDHVDTSRRDATAPHGRRGTGNGNVEAGISCVMPVEKGLYTGDEEGRVYEWTVVQRER